MEQVRAIWTLFLLGLTLQALETSAVWADTHARSAPLPKREKKIDFEDELVEGLSQRPLDSLSQVGEAARRKKRPHLYRIRVGFRAETLETLHELRFTP